jgi:hypothetical protein
MRLMTVGRKATLRSVESSVDSLVKNGDWHKMEKPIGRWFNFTKTEAMFRTDLPVFFLCVFDQRSSPALLVLPASPE